MAEAGEVFEGAELERLVQQERHGPIGRAARALEEREQRVKRDARRLGVEADVGRQERRRADHGPQQSLGRGGAALDVDVLAGIGAEPLSEPAQQVRASRAAAADEDRNARRRRVQRRQDAPFELRAGDRHHDALAVLPAPPAIIGSATPRLAAVASASG